MKLYVLPVERACNAKCAFCITNFRDPNKGSLLDKYVLRAHLNKRKFDKIEITGGGEPTSHPQIGEIIDICSMHSKTQMYTNGSLLRKVNNIEKLNLLCVSVAHYDGVKNKDIMGLNADFDIIKKINTPVKFSLLLHKSGISQKEEVLRYINWAGEYADKVVVRQLFEQDYKGKLNNEFISSENIFNELNIREYILTDQGNPIFNIGGLEVEVEYRSCACEMNNPVLHTNGLLYKGWSNELI